MIELLGAVTLSDIEKEKSFYESRYADSDIGAPIPQHILPPVEHRLWDKYVGSLEGKHVLECGSGDGATAVWLARQGALVTAVELSPVGVEKTRQRAKSHALENRVWAMVGDCCHLQEIVPPNSIDIALGFSVLHHLPKREFGQSLRVVLKPGAHAVFFENSNANPLYVFLRRLRNNESACGSPLTYREVEQLIAAVGTGERVYPRFGLFSFAKKYIFKNSRLFRAMVDAADQIIDRVPGSRRWSAHMWVVARKPAESLG
jgi:SAM-dependent methyltransferase